MKRTLSQLARVIGIAALCVVALSASPPKPIHPGGANAPVRIAIIADHYTLEKEFDYDVQNFVKYGLLADAFYKQYGASSMNITSYFEPTPAGQASRFGFEIGAGDGVCAVKAPDDILSKLMTATAAATVLPTHYVVIGNHPYNMGCTKGQWSYIAVDAVGTDVFQHELGHLVGLLYDEWALPSNGGASHLGLDRDQYNCAPKPGVATPTGTAGPPYWMNYPTKFPGAKALDGCDLYAYGVVHAYDSCRMGAMNHRMFCYVCAEAMKTGFGYVNSMPPPISALQPLPSHAPTATSGFRIINAAFVTNTAAQETSNPPRPVMRVLVDFDPGSSVPPGRAAKLEARQRIFAMSVYVPNHRRAGEFLYEISDKDGVRDVGIIPDSMFRSRSFQGGPHGTGPVTPVQLFMDLPNEDVKTAAITDRNLKVIVYRIPRSVTDAIITKTRWAELKANPDHKIGQVAEMPLPPAPPPK